LPGRIASAHSHRAGFSKPGIQFRDITTLIGHGHGMASTIVIWPIWQHRNAPTGLPAWQRAALFLAPQ